MIRNIVFDMGNVLLQFDPQAFVDRLEVSDAQRQCLLREVFGSPRWIELDRGDVTEADALADMCSHLPSSLHDAAERLLYWWREPTPIEGMEALIRELKALGYGLYVLSNAPANLHTYFPRIPGSDCMDGLIVSADHHLLKPQGALYEILLSTYALRAEECFFIDDTPANVDGARKAGLSGTVFSSLPQLRRDLRKAGIPVS